MLRTVPSFFEPFAAQPKRLKKRAPKMVAKQSAFSNERQRQIK
jgi:hypothetical protein